MKIKNPIPDPKELIISLLNDIDIFDKAQSNNKNYEGILTEKSAKLLKTHYPEIYAKFEIK